MAETATAPPQKKGDAKPPIDRAVRDRYEATLRGESHIQRFEAESAKLEKEINELRAKPEKQELPIDRPLFWKIVYGYAFVAMVILLTSIMLMVSGRDLGFYGLHLWHAGLLGIALVVLHAALSLDSVQLDERAGLKFFGRPVWKFEQAGLVFPIFGILKLTKEPRKTYQDVYPGKPENIVRFGLPSDQTNNPGTIVEKYEPGQVRPIFVTTGSPTTEELEALKALQELGMGEETAVLFKQFTVDIRFTIRWYVEYIFLFDRVIEGDTPEERAQSVYEQLRELAESELKESIRQLTPATVIQCWDAIAKRLAMRLRKIALDWGIWIDRVSLTEQNLSHETNARQAAAVRAAFSKIEALRKAEGERFKLIKEGEGRGGALAAEGRGKAAAEKALLVARAEGYGKIATDLGMTDKQVVLLAELAEKIALGANYSLFGGSNGISDFMAAVSAAKAVPPAGTRPDSKPAPRI